MRNAPGCLLVALIGCSLAPGQQPFEFWPGARYDASIPTYEKVLGYQPAERITSPEGLIRYLEALAAAAPKRIKIFDYGRTWEDRRLVFAVIGSEANMARLKQIQDGLAGLADPRKTPRQEAERLVASLPATVWLANGVHGNEISAPEASLLVAYHLLAARNDKLVERILSEVLVFIDPLQNPDGRARFLQHFTESLGLEPNANPDALEHVEPWPGGRMNHYLFDMNRDWFALTQPETRGRVRALLAWRPLVFVDLHEMGAEMSYYFAPEAEPYNPHLVSEQREALEWFGRNNARWFDQFGFRYFVREIFDAFYPGYGASWPAFHGAVSMTYEQASARGLLMQRRIDGEVFHFRETVRRQFVASISTLETAAQNRRRLLENFYRYRQTAIEEGNSEPVREYVLVRRGDTSAVDKLASLLAEQGVEVRRAAAPLTVNGREVPAGSYAIRLAQPAKRLIRTLLDPDVKMGEAFVKEQERLRSKKLPDEIYDIVAWSLPLVYGVEMVASPQPLDGAFQAVAPGGAPAGVVSGTAKLAYLAPWGTLAAGRLLTAALRQGLKVWSADRAFRLNGRSYSRGTLIFWVHENGAGLEQTLKKLAAATGAAIEATDTGYVEDGVSLGSRRVIPLKAPELAIAWDRPVSAYSAGHTRFVLERQYNYPTTPIRTSRLGEVATNLGRLDVIILPDGGSYGEVLGEAGLKRLRAWVEEGRTLIGIEGAVTWMADPKTDLLAIARENAARPAAVKEEKREARAPRVPGTLLAGEADYQKAIQAEAELPDRVPGVIARARLDEDHWVTAGLASTVNVMVRGRSVFTPIKLDKGVNAAVFVGPDELVASGHLWEENRKQLAFKPFLVVQRVGRGLVIGFTADPNFRAWMDGLNVLFLNAVFRSQAAARAALQPGGAR